jgi:YD repeat-containing protein
MLTAVSGDGYVKTFTYREDGKLTSRTLELTGWRTVQTQLAYNDAGDVSATTTVVKDANGVVLSSDTRTSKLDSYGRLQEAWLGMGGMPAVPWASVAYDGEGRVSSVDFTGGAHVAFGYDAFTRHRVTRTQTTATWSATTAQRMNARGLVESEDFTVGAQVWQRDYTYSAQGFLIKAEDAQDTYAYGYEADGLPTSIEENGASRTLVRTGDTLTAGNVTYTFDDLGRVVTKGDLILTYGPNTTRSLESRSPV